MARTRDERIAFNIKLITEVKAREPIWNVNVPEHKNASVVEKLWQQVADELNIPIKVAASRWKNLRDTFKRIKKKVDSEENSEIGKQQCSFVQWPYFQQLIFLTPFVTSTSTSDLISEIKSEENERCPSSSSFEVHVESDENRSLPGVSNVDSFKSSFHSSPKKRPRSKSSSWLSVFEQFVINEKQIENQLSDENQKICNRTQMDSFEMFLLSLASDLRNTPPELLPFLKMNLIYITSEYRKGNIPTSLVNIQQQVPN